MYVFVKQSLYNMYINQESAYKYIHFCHFLQIIVIVILCNSRDLSCVLSQWDPEVHQ